MKFDSLDDILLKRLTENIPIKNDSWLNLVKCIDTLTHNWTESKGLQDFPHKEPINWIESLLKVNTNTQSR